MLLFGTPPERNEGAACRAPELGDS
jgi:hypothetical protein